MFHRILERKNPGHCIGPWSLHSMSSSARLFTRENSPSHRCRRWISFRLKNGTLHANMVMFTSVEDFGLKATAQMGQCSLPLACNRRRASRKRKSSIFQGGPFKEGLLPHPLPLSHNQIITKQFCIHHIFIYI